MHCPKCKTDVPRRAVCVYCGGKLVARKAPKVEKAPKKAKDKEEKTEESPPEEE